MSFASDAVHNLFSLVESERDPVRRAQLLTDLGALFSDEMKDAVARTYIDLSNAGHRHRAIESMFGYTNRNIRLWARHYAKARGIKVKIRQDAFEPDDDEVIDLTHLMSQEKTRRLRRGL